MASILDEFLILFKPTVKGNGFQQLNNQIKQTHESLFNMKNLFGAFVGYDIYSGLKQFGGSLVNATREMGAMKSRFFAITQSQEKSNEQLEWAFKLAERTAMPMKSLADSYSIFYAATQKGLGDAGAQQVFQDWTEVSRVLHMSEYQFERVTYALREMASKGVVYSQDLRMQIGTHVPNAIGLAEKAVNDLGITGTDWFEKFQKQSKGNQKMINQFLVLFSKYAKEQFADPEAFKEAMKQPDAQIARLKNQWDKIRFAIAESGFGDDLAKALMKLNDTLDKFTEHSKKVYELLKDIAKIMGIIFAWVAFRRVLAFFKRISIILKAITKHGKLLGKTFGFSKKYAPIISKLFKEKGFKSFMKILGGQLLKRFMSMGLKGVIAFIPYIGQIIFLLWTVWDILSLIWDLLKWKLPKPMNKLRWWILNITTGISKWWSEIHTGIKIGLGVLATIALAFFSPVLAVIVGILTTIYAIKKFWGWWTHRKDKDKPNTFPGVQPDPNSWDYVYKQSLVAPLTSQLPSNNNYTFNPNIQYQNQIDVSGMSPEEASAMIADVMSKNNQDIANQFNMGVANSKNKA